MKKIALALLALLLFSVPALAKSTSNVKNNLKVNGTLTVTGTVTESGSHTIGGNLTVTGNTIHTGTLQQTGAATFSVGPTITGGLTAANIQTGSAKRQLIRFQLSPVTGDAVDSTIYRGYSVPGRAGTVKRITFSCQIAPTVGTDTIKVLKASSSGNTMLNAATFDANTLTAFVGSNATLTGTGADLQLTATQGIYAEYSAGTQTVDARDVEATIEYEPDDF